MSSCVSQKYAALFVPSATPLLSLIAPFLSLCLSRLFLSMAGFAPFLALYLSHLLWLTADLVLACLSRLVPLIADFVCAYRMRSRRFLRKRCASEACCSWWVESLMAGLVQVCVVWGSLCRVCGLQTGLVLEKKSRNFFLDLLLWQTRESYKSTAVCEVCVRTC